jgi:hypothetical protein
MAVTGQLPAPADLFLVRCQGPRICLDVSEERNISCLCRYLNPPRCTLYVVTIPTELTQHHSVPPASCDGRLFAKFFSSCVTLRHVTSLYVTLRHAGPNRAFCCSDGHVCWAFGHLKFIACAFSYEAHKWVRNREVVYVSVWPYACLISDFTERIWAECADLATTHKSCKSAFTVSAFSPHPVFKCFL